MLIYWTLFLAFTAGVILSQSTSERRPWALFVIFASIPTILMIGLRWKIGPDWDAYAEIYHNARLFRFDQVLRHVDPGYFFLNWELGQLAAPFWVLNLLCGLIFIIGLTAFCLRQPNPWLSYLTAFPYLVIVIGMSGARQSVALGFLFLALNAFEDGKLLRMTGLIIAGALFHSSLIVILPLFLFSYGKKSAQRLAMLAIILIVFIFEFQTAFSVYAARYASLKIQSGGLVYRLAMNTLAALLYFVFRQKLWFPEHMAKLWRNFSFATVVLVLLALVVPSSTAVDRFLLYLFPLQFAVLPRLPQALSSNRSPSFVAVAVIAYAALVQVIFLSLGTYSRFYVPYRSIFNA